MPLRELAKRLAVAALGIPLALYVVWMGGWALTLILAVIAALGAREFFLLAEAGGVRALQWVGIPGSVALVVAAGATRTFALAGPWALGILMGILLLSAISAIWLRWPHGSPLRAIPMTLMGALYCGGTLAFALFIRHLPEVSGSQDPSIPLKGLILLAFPIAVTWTGDSAAYFFGYAWGNRKLMPAVSPGKTVVGAVAGLVMATLVGGGLGVTILSLHPDRMASLALGAGVGLLLGMGAQLGDLVESVMKREAGIKDSGALLPGHGGILDRFDALYFTLPISYALIRMVGLLS